MQLTRWWPFFVLSTLLLFCCTRKKVEQGSTVEMRYARNIGENACQCYCKSKTIQNK